MKLAWRVLDQSLSLWRGLSLPGTAGAQRRTMSVAWSLIALAFAVAMSSYSIPVDAFPLCDEGCTPHGLAADDGNRRLYISTGRPDLIWVYDGPTGYLVTTLGVDGTPFELAINQKTKRLYVTLGNATPAVFDLSSFTIIARVPMLYTSSVTVDDGINKSFFANYFDNSVSVVDGASETLIDQIKVGRRPAGLAANPQSHRVYVTNSDDDSVSVINGTTHRVVTTIAVGEFPTAVAVNPLTNRVYVGNYIGQSITVIDGATDTKLANINVGDEVVGVAVDEVSNSIYVTKHLSGGVARIDGASHAIQGYPVGFRPTLVDVDSSTEMVYVANLNLDRYGTPLAKPNTSALYEREVFRNPSFDGDEDGDGFPNAWQATSLGPRDGLSILDPYDGRYAFRIEGVSGQKKQITQSKHFEGDAGATLTLYGASRADGASSTGGTYALTLVISFVDGSKKTLNVKFPKTTHGWDFKSISYRAPLDFSSLRVSAVYSSQTGTAWFDAVRLVIAR